LISGGGDTVSMIGMIGFLGNGIWLRGGTIMIKDNDYTNRWLEAGRVDRMLWYSLRVRGIGRGYRRTWTWERLREKYHRYHASK